MGLKATLARYAARNPHVLIAEAPGGWQQRAALERRALRRGWHIADNPADADVLAICGRPGPELTKVIGKVWDQLPGPRAGLGLAGSDTDATEVDTVEVDAALKRASAYLADIALQRTDARERRPPDIGSTEVGSSGTDTHDMDMDMDGGMHMDMAPSGIPLAGGGDDRDGLEMDVLQLRLGPVLRHWPAGVVVQCSLQGDLIVDARAWLVDADQTLPPPSRSTRTEAARQCDRLSSLLALAGWPHAATRARRVRDLLLATDEPALDELDALQRTVTRARIFNWSMRGVTDGHTGMLARARALLTDSLPPPTSVTTLADLPERIIGIELATARLVIAGLETLEITDTAAQPGATDG
ncbi:hypothetical protein NGTWS0302_11140 [Mycolicibacterium cyprinidarum]|uniref:Uncharacterized protein n=1 Tax=Mycolicibacterium cyprinidarum TaxID=2860311 RepID=A0ABQ4VD96_9MYCO|nr:hypothetical protein NGTWS1702_13110 [Mycolicibacterium sp. NGTWSNA01]GJF16207.1 hypothetical protein NGTWS0302_11140 [Mycolicibacterium sp. NGTWS0302]